MRNGFSKHLAELHPEEEGSVEEFKFELVKTFASSLERQVTEAICIHRCDGNYRMNSKAEFLQPAVERIIITRHLEG